MYATLVIGGIILIAALLTLACWCCYRLGRDDGYEARIADEKQQRADERAAERKAGRHARTQPRRAPDKTALVRSDDRITWERDEAVGGPVEIPGKWYADRMRMRTATDVILPEPGTYPPAPRRTTSPDTGTMPRIRLETGTSGEIRAIGDELVAAIEAGAPE